MTSRTERSLKIISMLAPFVVFAIYANVVGFLSPRMVHAQSPLVSDQPDDEEKRGKLAKSFKFDGLRLEGRHYLALSACMKMYFSKPALSKVTTSDAGEIAVNLEMFEIGMAEHEDNFGIFVVGRLATDADRYLFGIDRIPVRSIRCTVSKSSLSVIDWIVYPD